MSRDGKSSVLLAGVIPVDLKVEYEFRRKEGWEVSFYACRLSSTLCVVEFETHSLSVRFLYRSSSMNILPFRKPRPCEQLHLHCLVLLFPFEGLWIPSWTHIGAHPLASFGMLQMIRNIRSLFTNSSITFESVNNNHQNKDIQPPFGVPLYEYSRIMVGIHVSRLGDSPPCTRCFMIHDA